MKGEYRQVECRSSSLCRQYSSVKIDHLIKQDCFLRQSCSGKEVT